MFDLNGMDYIIQHILQCKLKSYSLGVSRFVYNDAMDGNYVLIQSIVAYISFVVFHHFSLPKNMNSV